MVSRPLPRFDDALFDAFDCTRSFSILHSGEVSVQLSVICIYVVLQAMFPEDGPKSKVEKNNIIGSNRIRAQLSARNEPSLVKSQLTHNVVYKLQFGCEKYNVYTTFESQSCHKIVVSL